MRASTTTRWSRITAPAFFLVAALVFPSSAHATDPYGQTTATFDNVYIRAMVQIPGITADGMKISGTAIEVLCSGSAGPNGATPQVYTDAQVFHGKLSAGGEVIFDDDFPLIKGSSTLRQLISPGPIQEAYAQTHKVYQARFASTHFAHDTSLPVTLELSFHLTRLNGSVIDKKVATTITPKVYNKAFVFATKIPVNNVPPLPTASQTSKPAAIDAECELASYNHAVQHGTGEIDAVDRATILSTSVLALSTVFWADSHGGSNSSGFYDSFSESDPLHFVTWGNVGLQVGNKNSGATPIPPYNLAILYFCSSLGAGNATTAFDLTRQSDCGAAGFTGTYTTVIWAGRTDPVNMLDILNDPPDAATRNHNQELMLRLCGGKALEDAITAANAAFPPRVRSNGVFVPCEMTSVGDKRTRIVNVYLTMTEESALPPSKVFSWYYVIR